VDFDKDHPSDAEGLLDEIIASYLEAEEGGLPPDRQELLDSHPDLRAPLARFFAEHDRMAFLAQPLRGAVRAGCPGFEGRRVGNYQVLEPIGWGGMGVVYKARQENPGRLVALKMIRAGRLASPQEMQRFRNEAAAEARLDHPNIVPIYEVGEHEGHHYFSMKLLEGGNLSQYLRGGAAGNARLLPLRQAVGLVATVARAVHHAHQRGILHRDLKPSNVLLDGAGVPFVADFGLARQVEGDSTLTETGVILGTPGYMAPEQAAARKELVTVAADVYGLGAILYALLTGQAPFQGGSALDVLTRVRQQEPEPPSRQNPRVDRDLEAVCLKCLEKEPGARYGSAEALAEELQRWLAGEPTQARPVGKLAQAWRWCRRRKALAGLVAALVLAVLGAVASLTVGLVAASRARVTAEAHAAALRRQLYPADMARAFRHFQQGEPEELKAVLARYVPEPGQEDLRGFEWYLLRNLAQALARERFCYRGHRGEVMCAIFAPGGKEVVSGDEDGEIHCWDAATGACRRVLRGHREDVNGLDFSPDGLTLVSGGEDGAVRLWDYATGRPTALLLGPPGQTDQIQLRVLAGQSVASGATLTLASGMSQLIHLARLMDAAQGEVESVCYSRDGRRIVSAGSNGSVSVWDVASRVLKRKWVAHSDRVYTAVFSRDGRRIATASVDHHCRLWDSDSGAMLLDRDLQAGVFDVCFAPDGAVLATVDGSGTVGLWDGKSTHSWAALARHGAVPRAVAFSPDGQRLASVGDDRVLRLWTAGQPLTLSGGKAHGHTISSVAFSPDGKKLVTGSRDHTVRVWDEPAWLPRAIPHSRLGHSDVHVALSADARLLVAWQPKIGLTLYDRVGQEIISRMAFEADMGGAVALSPDCQAAAVSGWHLTRQEQVIKRFSLQSEEGRRRWAVQGEHFLPGRVHVNLTFTPDGAWLAAVASEALQLWSGDSPVPIVIPRRPWGSTDLITSSPDSQRLAVASARTVQFFDLPHLTWDAAALELQTDVQSLAYSPDSQLLAAGCADGSIAMIDHEARIVQGTLLGHREGVATMAFAPDGRTLVSGSSDGTVRLWNVPTRQELFTLEDRFGRTIRSVVFTPDGSTLITSGAPTLAIQSLMFWHAPRDGER
jgi:WD40 repeat protein/tRNA A-37 threonylcarbamoyl transferase component Bud32